MENFLLKQFYFILQIPAQSAWGKPSVVASAAASGASGRGAVSMQAPGAAAPPRFAAPATLPMQGGEGRATLHRGAGDAGSAARPVTAAKQGTLILFVFIKGNGIIRKKHLPKY